MARGLISFGRRISMLAAEHPERAAIIFSPQDGPERRLSWRELDSGSNRLARLLARVGVDADSLVVVGLPNCPEHFLVDYAAWKLGALVLPMRAALPARERDQILALGRPAVVVADWEDVAWPALRASDLRAADGFSADPLPDVVPDPGYAIPSGGSTGRSKIIVTPGPYARDPDQLACIGYGFAPRQTQLVTGPLYHNSPFGWSNMGLFLDQTLVLMERFDAARAIDLIERQRVNWAFLAPTMMRRILLVPDIHERDLSSIEGIFQTAAPCPPWLKRAWIDLIGGDKLHEGFGSAEALGSCYIRGDEWLAHPGSVGRPSAGSELRILNEDGSDLPPGAVGEIFMRRKDRERTYYYIGSEPAKSTPDGFASVGDMGWVDEDGYLYLADRRVDLIITGGANVYPAEVEGVLLEHAGVFDVAVVGVPDEDWGKRVHAIVQPRDRSQPPAPPDLDRHCRERLAAYKAPKTYELVDALPRDDTGKLRRSALAAERAAGWTAAMVSARGAP